MSSNKLSSAHQADKFRSHLKEIRMRRQAGFTIIEMLIMVIIVMILAAVALPHYVGSEDKSRESKVKYNMRVAQIAAESFAAENGGQYPDKIDEHYYSFFPGGPGDGKNAGGARGLQNPYTLKFEWPITGAVTDVQAARASAPTQVGNAGQIEYSPIKGADGVKGYAIRGASQNGSALPGVAPMTTLVLTRQN